MALAPPMLEILGASNFVLDFAGATSSGKTTTLRVAASCWGKPDERSDESAMHTWDVTRVFLERASTIISGMPLILDDTKRAKDPSSTHGPNAPSPPPWSLSKRKP